MDTHVTTGVLDSARRSQARLPGEPEPVRPEPVRSEPDQHERDAEPLRAGPRSAPAAPTAPSSQGREAGRKRKSGLLSGVAIIAVTVIAGGGFLLSPYNTFVPVPPGLKLQAAQLLHRGTLWEQEHLAMLRVRRQQAVTGQQAATGSATAALPPPQGAHPNVLAPSASLAAEKTTPASPPVRQAPYIPAPPQDEMAELEGFQPLNTGQVVSTPTPSAAAKQVTVLKVLPPAAATAAEPDPADMVPPGYVSHEPGAAPKTVIAMVPPPLPAPVKSSAALHAAAVTAPKPKPAASVATSPIVPTPATALTTAAKIEAAPMSQPEQVQVLELVTQLATLIRDERTQISNLQSDEQNGDKATTAKLGDFERRLALVEANQAMASARDAPATVSTLTTPAVSPTLVKLISARAAMKAASQPIPRKPVSPAALPAVTPPVTPEIYRVQAASPGLAMLAEVDHSGGDSAQIEVQVGDTLPGYGHVIAVTQQGTNWVVKTDNGFIK